MKKKPTNAQLTRYMKSQLKKYVCRWAFLTPNLFSYSDSLKYLRKDFGYMSKMGMLTDATYPTNVKFHTDEMMALDTLNDFTQYLKNNGITKINPYRE